MKHVALVIPTLDRLAGAERQVMLLAAGLLDRRWRVSVVALSGTGGDAARELRGRGASFLSLRMRKGLTDTRGWLHFHRWLRSESPDVVHAHLPHAVWMARWSRLFAPSPVLVDSIHTSSTGTWGRRLGYRVSHWLPDRVFAVSESAADAYRSRRMVSPSRLAVMPNGVDVDRWRPDAAARREMRERLGLADEFLWLAAGRLDAVKNYPALLCAMLQVPARLVIAGAGRVETELRSLSVRLGLESRVRFLGYEPDVLPWMQAADAFVLCSRWEGLPISLLEAGACGLPAVATNVSGSRDVIVDGVTGLLAAPDDLLAVRAAMTRMMHYCPETRMEMGRQARRRVTECFGLSSVLDAWERHYCNLLETQPDRARWAAEITDTNGSGLTQA